jgi:L-rhamnose mutarotase
MRRAFRMRLKPGCEEIYRQKHDEVWPGVVDALFDDGVTTFSIYRSGLDLFAYIESTKPPKSPQDANQITREWWLMMEPYMEYNDDHTPKTWDLEEMFHMEASAEQR